MFLGRSGLAWHSGFVFSVSKLAKRRLQPLVPKQQATDRDNTKNPMQVLKPRDLHLSSFASSNHSAFIQFAASLCRRWSTAPSPESSRHHHSPPKCRASKRAILKKRPSITASSKSCQGDQRASTHSSSSHFLRRAPHLSSLPLTAGPTLRAHFQSLAGCCMARSAVSNGSHGLADWRKAVRLRSLAAVSERQACNQAAERARCADFGSSDLASCQKLLIPRPCPTQCVDLRHTHTCKHSTPTSHAKPRRRDAKQVQ